MSSNLRVNNILPSVGTNVAIGTAGGSITLTGSVTGSSITNTGTTVVAAGTTSAPSISPTGDSNTGIFFPAADTVSIAEGGVEALRVDSSSNIGIGTTGTGDKLTVLGRVQIQQDSGSNNRLILRGQPGSTYRWNIDNNGSSNDLRIFREDDVTTAGGLVYASLSSSGNLTLNNGNLVIGTAGKGIDFSATANSSGTMTSELLDDYEVGTFTPFFAAGTVSGGYTTQTGTYVKIGRLVTFSLIIDGNGNLQGAAQGIQIGGLPFTAQPGVAQLGGAYIVANQSFDITNNRRFWYASGTVLVYTDASGNVVNGNAVNNVNSDLYLTGQYFTAS